MSDQESADIENDPSAKPSGWRQALVGGVVLLLGVGIAALVIALVGSDDDTPEAAAKPKASPVKSLFDVPSVDPSESIQPLKEKVDASTLPALLRGRDLVLPKPGPPATEVQNFCNSVAGVISGKQQDLLRNLYGETPGPALDADEALAEAYNDQVDKVLAKAPATPRPLLSLRCSNVQVESDKFANGSHRVTFSLAGSLISRDGRIYAKSLWDSSNILERRTVTLNRDGFSVREDGSETKGLKAEFSEIDGVSD